MISPPNNNAFKDDSSVLGRLADYVDRFAEQTPDAISVVSRGERLTYRELKARVDACARALLACGVAKGDRVAMLCTPRSEFWITFLATGAVGGIWVGLNPKYQQSELEHVIRDSKPVVLLSLTDFEGRSYEDGIADLVKNSAETRQVVWIGGPENQNSWKNFLVAGQRIGASEYESRRAGVQTMDPALIVYTSGTTGKPKGAVISHWGLTYGASLQTDHFAVPDPSMVISFPINHVASVADCGATTLVKGGKLVFQERFDPIDTLDALEEERVTLWGGVPTMLQMQLATDDFDQRDLSSVKLVIWGGAAMPRDAVIRLQALGPRLMAAYGMTETSCHVTYSDDNAELDVLAETIGKPDLRCPCRVMREDGQLCQTGEEGELHFKGDFLMLGYWNLPEASAEVFTEDGWLRTGDLGFFREDGNISLKGRRSEMFKSGGYNVYPREIEMVLEGFREIAAAAVIGLTDPLYQEVGHAFLLLEPGQLISEDELRDRCRGKLANYKIPKRFFPCTELPMLPVGKIDKMALKKVATTVATVNGQKNEQ